ncbi:MAG: hypothetical protein HQ511_00570 [Rhodospirillales bacterium]|nr:hypothetical protein [Rhodospirillales bacterium]
MGPTRFASVLLAIILAASVSVVTPARAEKSDAVAATVAATVDGENVLVSEVDSLAATLLAQYPTAPLDELKRQVVQRLVERKLIVHAAVKAGLDKDPAVLKRFEALKEDVLQEIFLTARVDERKSPRISCVPPTSKWRRSRPVRKSSMPAIFLLLTRTRRRPRR